MAYEATTEPKAADQVVNGVKLIADVAVLPGLGQLAEGKIAEGAIYGVGGLAATALLGPLGWIAWVGFGLDSYSKSASGRHLWELRAPKSDTTTTV